MVDGPMRYRGNKLFIDEMKFLITQNPKAGTSNDSVYAPLENDIMNKYKKNHVVLATMNLKHKNRTTCIDEYHFFKIINY